MNLKFPFSDIRSILQKNIMNKISLDIITLTTSATHNNSFVVVLGENKGNRRLPIIIGGAEAQSIVVAMEGMNASRPLTHDLIKNVMLTYDIVLKEVIINRFVEGIFYSQLVCERDGQEEVIDSRTSDAIAISLRFNCPIYTYSSIIDAAGVEMEILEEDIFEENEESLEHEEQGNEYSMYTAVELETLLSEALDNEDYERAAAIRDEMSKR